MINVSFLNFQGHLDHPTRGSSQQKLFCLFGLIMFAFYLESPGDLRLNLYPS